MRLEDDRVTLGGQDREQVRPDGAGQRREVIGTVDGGAVVDVVGARDEDRPDPRVDEPAELGRDELHRAARLDVRVEEIPGDEDEVDLLGDGQVDGRAERRELALALRGGLFAEVRVAGTEVNVGRVEHSEHSVCRPPGWILR